MRTPVTDDLDARGVDYRLFTHPGAIKSLEQAARERNQQPEQVVRSILFRVAESEYVMVLMAGPGQIAWPALRSYLGIRRIRMASPEEIQRVTGYQIGAVSPFGLAQPLRILVDESVFVPEEVSIGSGVRGTTLLVQREDLRQALGEVEMGRFGDPKTPGVS